MMKFFHRFLSVSARNEKIGFLSYWEMQDKHIKVTQLFNYFNSSLCIILCVYKLIFLFRNVTRGEGEL
jgi:hypothetical protein